MRSKAITAVVWLVLAAPLIVFGVYEWVVHPHHHPDAGPHGGPLAEWGKHEYTLEVVAGPEAGAVTVYVLDRWAVRPRSIDARTVTVTTSTVPPAVVELAAAPQEGDPPGRSSRFTAEKTGLRPGADFRGTITGTVGGRVHRGEISPGGTGP